MKKIFLKIILGIFVCLLYINNSVLMGSANELTINENYNGVYVDDSGYRFFYDNGEMVTECWKTIDGKKYYFGIDGKAATGCSRIQGKYYIFNDKSELFSFKNNTIVKMGDVKYCVKPSGRAAKGWHYIKGKVYYADKTGKCAAGKKVSYIYFTKNGYAKDTDQALAKILAREFIDEHCNKNMSNSEKFKTCFHYIMANTNFVGSWRPKKFEKKGWQYRAAVSMFQTDLMGSCYGIASAVAAVAKELGYKPYVISTTAGHCFVKIGDKYYDNMNGAVFGTSTHEGYKIKEKCKF